MFSESSFAVLEGGPRDRSSVKAHAVCGIEAQRFFHWGFAETRFAGDENCDREADTIWLGGWGYRVFAACGAGESVKPVVERSETPGTR